ncbi:baculovirus FP protein domain-containing protein [Phthorimaea operculella]|nr:baculovirus FP protein domain-containing protein [Phthorimaea operculella]
MELKIHALEQMVTEFQQEKLDSSLEISGVPKVQDENLNNIAESLATVLQVEKPTDIQVKRLPSHPKKPDLIVIKMQDKYTKMQWITASRKKSIIAKEIIPNLDSQVGSTPVYIREAMTPFNKKLFWMAKQELKPAFKYVWFKDGKILVKKQENSKLFVLRNECDIDNLLECEKLTA